MSTLTSSPSPAASPCAAFVVQHSSRASSSSSSSFLAPTQRSPAIRRYSASSPRRASNAPAASAAHPSQQHLRLSVVDSVSAPAAIPTYVDAGTQYSPDGLPPTAKRKVAAVAGPSLGSASTSTRKRKETATRNSPEPMSSTSASSSAGPTPAAPFSGQPASQSHRDVPSPAPASTEEEPQEARSIRSHAAASKRSRPDPGNAKVMPLKYETCSPKDLGILISNMLMELIRINDRIPLRDGRLTRFHSRAPPGISVSDYLQRLIQHATLSPPIMLSMVYYIDRLCTMYPAFTINSLTVHRFLITAATVAAKGLSDSFWTNPTYARIGGIPVSELATLELELLQKVHWKIVPKPEVLEEYYLSLVNRAEGYALEESNSSSVESSSISESEAGPRGSEERKEDEIMSDEPT